MSDELTELPEGWTWASAEECTKRITDGEHITPERSETGVLLLSARNVKNGWISLDKVDYIPEHIYEILSRRLSIEPGDVLLSCSGTIGRSCVAPKDLKFALVRSVAVLKPFEGMGEFISYALRSPQIQQQIQAKKTQTAQANIFQGSIKKLIFPIPPLNEQKRIVAKIEELRDRLNRSKQALEAVPELCDRFRQSVLAAAFRGDLTADWREENPDVEPASVLLERIRSSFISDSANISVEFNCLQDLPESWKLIQIRDICKNSFYGPRFGKNEYVNDGIPTIRTTDMTDGGEIILRDPPKVKVAEGRLNDFKLMKDDLLITRTGSIGMMAVFREDYIAIPSAYLIRFRFAHLVLVDYIFYYLKSPLGQDLLGLGSTAVTQPNINAEVIKNLPFPLASLAEQKEVVKRIKSLFTAIGQIEQQYQHAESQLDRLNQSILAKAFRGELVEQDPNDEPASVLLDRIRVERQSQEGKKSGGARGKRKKASNDQLDLPEVE